MTNNFTPEDAKKNIKEVFDKQNQKTIDELVNIVSQKYIDACYIQFEYSSSIGKPYSETRVDLHMPTLAENIINEGVRRACDHLISKGWNSFIRDADPTLIITDF